MELGLVELITIAHTQKVQEAAGTALEALGLLSNAGRTPKKVFALVSLLRSDVPTVQQEAAAVLASKARGRRRARDTIGTGVALPRLGHLLCSSSSPEVQQAAAEALASLAMSAAYDMAMAMAATPGTIKVVEKMFSSNGSASQQAGTATLVKQLALLSNMAEDIARSQEVMKHLVAGLSSSSAAAVVEATASAVEQLAAKAVNSRDHLQKLPELVARLNRVESSSDATITAAAKDAAAAALGHLGFPPERKVRLYVVVPWGGHVGLHPRFFQRSGCTP